MPDKNDEKITKELSECYAYAKSAQFQSKDECVCLLASCVRTLTEMIAEIKGITLYDL